ncbi:MAG TPA: C39 family peptidase [Patescibacteria group bacterium]|jgi:hypothetical protein|nr:C39 family peptidase [Patescibacteria group bacterium]
MVETNKAGVAVVAVGLAIGGFLLYKNMPWQAQATVILQVPFTSQAPNNNWSRNEDCEETSITMANAYLSGRTEDKLPAEPSQGSIDILKKWEQANLGYNADTGADATTRMAEGGFGLKVRQIKDFTAQDLKDELTLKHPILLPINAKLLGSPQYKNDGPTYHMIVLRGFKGDRFIVNDPGTDSGDGNEYSFSTLKKAAADWNHVTNKMEPDRKIALVVSK